MSCLVDALGRLSLFSGVHDLEVRELRGKERMKNLQSWCNIHKMNKLSTFFLIYFQCLVTLNRMGFAL